MTKTTDEATEIAKRLEADSNPKDHSQKREDVSWDDINTDVQRAVADNITDKVAQKLDKDGYPDAAEYVRNAGSTGIVGGDDDLGALLAALMGGMDDDGDGPFGDDD